MNKAEAKQIIADVKSISRFKCIISDINNDLEEIACEIECISNPKCPNSNTGIKSSSHVEKSTVINSLLSDEMDLIKKRERYESRLAEALNYHQRLMNITLEEDKPFLIEFLNNANYKQLEYKFHCQNPYRKALDLVKKL